MTDKELGELYSERAEVAKRLSQINAAIGQGQRDRTTDECVALMCEHIEDNKAAARYIEEHLKKRRKEELKEEKRLVNGITYLYGLYDKGKLVYVGITKNLSVRMRDHESSDKVFDDFNVLAEHSDRFYALRSENELIKEHRPKYNKQSF